MARFAFSFLSAEEVQAKRLIHMVATRINCFIIDMILIVALKFDYSRSIRRD
jgi:hypothetical protein